MYITYIQYTFPSKIMTAEFYLLFTHLTLTSKSHMSSQIHKGN